jgi:hypothetical protein
VGGADSVKGEDGKGGFSAWSEDERVSGGDMYDVE